MGKIRRVVGNENAGNVRNIGISDDTDFVSEDTEDQSSQGLVFDVWCLV